MPVPHKNKKESQLIPVLFTIGVIGWGFFAIDRLTSSEVDSELEIKNNFRNIPAESHQQNVSFFQEVKDWLLAKLIQMNEEEVNKKNLPVLPESSLNIKRMASSPPISTSTIKIDDTLPSEKPRVISSENSQEIKNSEERLTSDDYDKKLVRARLYFYKTDRSEMKLYPVERLISLQGFSNKEEAVFQQLLAGPNGSERMNNFLDSFPQKTEILSAKQDGNVMTINFKRPFGSGLSHQMVKLQLRQLFRTAKTFKGISKMRLMLKNKPLKKLSSDGILLPNFIDKNSWLLSSTY